MRPVVPLESPQVLFCCQYLTHVALVRLFPRAQSALGAPVTLGVSTCEAEGQI